MSLRLQFCIGIKALYQPSLEKNGFLAGMDIAL